MSDNVKDIPPLHCAFSFLCHLLRFSMLISLTNLRKWSFPYLSEAPLRLVNNKFYKEFIQNPSGYFFGSASAKPKKEVMEKNLIYNQFHNILRLFDVLPNFPFTTSETIGDYYL